jgi:signal transduction histidine kinase
MALEVPIAERHAEDASSPPLRLLDATTEYATPAARIAALEHEREELWTWIFHLERLSQAGLMAGGLAHDTRNLLTGISGLCQIALVDDEGKDQRTTLSRANDLALQAAEAMRVFLTFARRSGRAPGACRVSDVVEDALRFLAPVLSKGRVAIVKRLSPDAVACCERTLLLQTMVNLVLNASKALGDSPGRIDVSAFRSGDQVFIEVADDGPGIPEAVRRRLFQPFATTGGASGGTGLGLYVTRRIVEDHGGTVDVESEPGRGARFRIALPAPVLPERTPLPATPRSALA